MRRLLILVALLVASMVARAPAAVTVTNPYRADHYYPYTPRAYWVPVYYVTRDGRVFWMFVQVWVR